VSSPGTCRGLADDGASGASKRILAIDDDTTVRDVLTLFLGDRYAVSAVTSGSDALVRLRYESVDLALLDHRLPDCTGLDILPELRSIRPNLPVIMLTGYGSEWICAAAFKLGVADYLQKPVSAADLVGAVQRILGPDQDNAAPPPERLMLVSSRLPRCRPVEMAMGLIQRHYWDRFSLSVLARQVGMSKHRLSHRFHEVLGITFRDYLLRVRLERAKTLLSAEQVSITEVAQLVGFGDLPRFDKVFKRYTGLTPSAYRSLTPGRNCK
jgi:two-component system, response regulator YesN